MTLARFVRPLAAAMLVCAVVPSASLATTSDTSKKIGEFGSWSVFAMGEGKTCFAQSQPTQSAPKKAKRDPIFFVLSDWPARHARGEAEVTPGYPYKKDGKVTVQIGADKFDFFSENEGGKGHAWVKQEADDSRLLDALKRGERMSVTGISERGTLTRDDYSLTGLSAALKAADDACGM